jgi:hypothetical protein
MSRNAWSISEATGGVGRGYLFSRETDVSRDSGLFITIQLYALDFLRTDDPALGLATIGTDISRAVGGRCKRGFATTASSRWVTRNSTCYNGKRGADSTESSFFWLTRLREAILLSAANNMFH